MLKLRIVGGPVEGKVQVDTAATTPFRDIFVLIEQQVGKGPLWEKFQLHLAEQNDRKVKPLPRVIGEGDTPASLGIGPSGGIVMLRHRTSGSETAKTPSPRGSTVPLVQGDWRARMIAIYEKYDPAKVGTVDASLEKFKGREEAVIRKLVQKYGPEPTPHAETGAGTEPQSGTHAPSTARSEISSIGTATTAAANEHRVSVGGSHSRGTYRERMIAIYEKYDPAKVGTVDASLEKFKGREEAVIRKLVQKYGPEPALPGPAPLRGAVGASTPASVGGATAEEMESPASHPATAQPEGVALAVGGNASSPVTEAADGKPIPESTVAQPQSGTHAPSTARSEISSIGTATTAAANEHRVSVGGSHSRGTYRERMIAIYEKYDSAKVGTVDASLEKFKGREEAVIRKLVQKYGPEPQEATPERIPDNVSVGSRGTSASKIPSSSPKPEAVSAPATAPTSHTPSVVGQEAGEPEPSSLSYQERLTAIYSTYDPAKVGTVKATLLKFKGKEEAVISKLVQKYGPEPPVVRGDNSLISPQPADTAESTLGARGRSSTNTPATSPAQPNPPAPATPFKSGAHSLHGSSRPQTPSRIQTPLPGQHGIPSALVDDSPSVHHSRKTSRPPSSNQLERDDQKSGRLSRRSTIHQHEDPVPQQRSAQLLPRRSSGHVDPDGYSQQRSNRSSRPPSSHQRDRDGYKSARTSRPSSPHDAELHSARNRRRSSRTPVQYEQEEQPMTEADEETDDDTYAKEQSAGNASARSRGRHQPDLAGYTGGRSAARGSARRTRSTSARNSPHSNRHRRDDYDIRDFEGLPPPPRRKWKANANAGYHDGVSSAVRRERSKQGVMRYRALVVIAVERLADRRDEMLGHKFWSMWKQLALRRRAEKLIRDGLWERVDSDPPMYRMQQKGPPTYTIPDLQRYVEQGSQCSNLALPDALQYPLRDILSIASALRMESGGGGALLTDGQLCPVKASKETAIALMEVAQQLLTIAETKAELRATQRKLSAAHDKIENLQERVTQCEPYVERCRQAEEAVERLHGQISELQELLKAATSDHNNMKYEIHFLQKELDKERRGIPTDIEKVIHQKDAAIAVVQQELAKARAKVYRQQNENTTLRSQLEDLSYTLVTLRRGDEVRNGRGAALGSPLSARKSLPKGDQFTSALEAAGVTVHTQADSRYGPVQFKSQEAGNDADFGPDEGNAELDLMRENLRLEAELRAPSSTATVSRGKCPHCLTKLTSCSDAEHGAPHERAAFCFSCRKPFSFADLAARDSRVAPAKKRVLGYTGTRTQLQRR